MIIILLALGMWAVPPAWAAEPKPKFQVGAISKGKTLPGTRRINGEYPKSKPTIEFTVTPAEDIPMSEFVSFIYFFNDKNELVHKRSAGLDFDSMNLDMTKTLRKMEDMSRKAKSGSISVPMDLPSTAQAGKKYQFQHVIQDDTPKWSHVVVVAGRRDADLTGRVYPKADLQAFNFPDKSKVTYWYQP